MAEHGIKRRPYPYRISPVDCPDGATLKRLDPWQVQEFFRVELLLRSQSVMDLYKSEEISPTSSIRLLFQYGFGWDVLQGEPHHCLTPNAGPMGALAGVSTSSTFPCSAVKMPGLMISSVVPSFRTKSSC